ncbi:hypothetical protein [Flavobacterium davisii]|uniref:Class IIb bacteriocin, lactobin A/cerein 7B family n=1 Tax=Flavobacterium columnare TaxID=996 RepID=A0A8G0KPY3_9FLAO|nr:hypothetical protein [Flavobacterium davisii]QYS87997.1 hypothetical protein JJC05_08850 [Flavobacterium davisii]
MIKMENLKELSREELVKTEGGLIEFLGLCAALFAIGYEIGKDAKERSHN